MYHHQYAPASVAPMPGYQHQYAAMPGMPGMVGHHQPSHGQHGHRHLTSNDIKLSIRQQPKEALVTLAGKEKARKPVDPPPIVHLEVTSSADPHQHFLQSPYLFMSCSLLHKTEPTKINQEDGSETLAGSLVSSLHRLKDTDNRDGGFFVFGDVSVRVVGEYRLHFSLFDFQKETEEVAFLGAITSSPFKVVPQKDFRGLEESTYLSRAFSDQGVRLRLRKEPRAFAGQKRGYPYQQRSNSRELENSQDNSGYEQQYKDEGSPINRKRMRSNGEFEPEQKSPFAVRPISISNSALTYSSPPPTYAADLGQHYGRSDYSYPQHVSGPYIAPSSSTASNYSNGYTTISAGQQSIDHGHSYGAPYQGSQHYHLPPPSGRDMSASGGNHDMTNLSVQPHTSVASVQSSQMTSEHEFGGDLYSNGGNSLGSIELSQHFHHDPAMVRPKGRYEESVDNQVQVLRSKGEPESDLHFTH